MKALMASITLKRMGKMQDESATAQFHFEDSTLKTGLENSVIGVVEVMLIDLKVMYQLRMKSMWMEMKKTKTFQLN